MGYEIAHADRHCLCECKHSKMLANYKTPHFGPTKWKAGTPTTSLPSWVKKQSNKLSAKEVIHSSFNDTEVYGDVSEPTDINGTAQSGTATSSSVKQELSGGKTDINEQKKPATIDEEKNDDAPAENEGGPTKNEGVPAANDGEILNTTDGNAVKNEEGAPTDNQMADTIDEAKKTTTGTNNEEPAKSEEEAKVDNTGATTNAEPAKTA